MKEEPAPKEEPQLKKDVDESPCLESFFKKTSAMPPLYWLPLNEEQAIERAKTREAKVGPTSVLVLMYSPFSHCAESRQGEKGVHLNRFRDLFQQKEDDRQKLRQLRKNRRF